MGVSEEQLKANVWTFFASALPNLPSEERTAHAWGLQFMEAHNTVREKMCGWAESREASNKRQYVEGYLAWYFCGRPSKTPVGVAQQSRPELCEFTVSDDCELGSADHKHQTPALVVDLKSQATLSFENTTACAAPPAKVARKAAWDVERAEEPLDVATRVWPRFLCAPQKRYTFEASDGASWRQWAEEVVEKDRILRLVNTKGGAQREILSASGVEIGDRLLNLQGSGKEWPGFESLGLKFLARGSYNVVFEHACAPVTQKLREILPKAVCANLALGNCVLRVPTSWETFDDSVSELANMAEAAGCGYGPLVAGAWVGQCHLQCRYKLFAVLQRGTADLSERLGYGSSDATPLSESPVALERLFWSLSKCVWQISANRCVFLDAKPGNFIDTFPRAMDSCVGTVRAIDMDASSFRRLSPAPESGSQGWRVVWLYNVLFVSVFLRSTIHNDTIFGLWWDRIKKAVAHTLQLLKRRDVLVEDEDYQRALAFANAARWTGGFYMERELPVPASGTDPEAVASAAVGFCTHYFHDSLFRMATNAIVRPMRKKRTSLPLEWYAKNWLPRMLPMVRFFEQHMSPTSANAPLLVEVMRDFCESTREELLCLVDPAKHGGWRAPNANRWPKALDVTALHCVDWHSSSAVRAALGFGPRLGVSVPI